MVQRVTRSSDAVYKAAGAAVKAAASALSKLSDAELERVIENLDLAYTHANPDMSYADWKHVAHTLVYRYAWVLTVLVAAAELRQREQAERIRRLEQECAVWPRRQ
jgi:hypothetical protein